MKRPPLHGRSALLGALAAILPLACAAPPEPAAATIPANTPYVVVLGTAQDGGLPQIACRKPCCEAARRDPSRRRLVTSLLLVDPRSEKRWLFDASPHLPLQVERARAHGGPAADTPGRPALFDGVFLTHAHLGHYAGLLQFGREAYGSAPVALWGTERMLHFLQGNGPWSLLFDAGHATAEPLRTGQPVQLAEGLSVTPIEVPHRDEFSDTVGFVIEGPGRSVLYLPDIDKWDRWDRDLRDVIAGVDVALVDGTFFGQDELPGRDMADVPHPFIVESMATLASAPASERAKVYFTHLNHSNPAADPTGAAARTIDAKGFHVAREGQLFAIGSTH